MNFRDPVLERARFLLLQLAEGDQDLLDREIRAEPNTHGEVHLSYMTERSRRQTRRDRVKPAAA